MRTSKITPIGVGIFLTLSVNVGAGDFKHITIDGSFADWAGVAPSYEDPSDATGGNDLKAVYVAHDDQYLYVRFTLYAPGEPFTSQNNIFIDADNDPATGYDAAGRLFGSEMLIQTGVGYQEKGAGFNEGGIDGLDWAAAPAREGTDFEFRISRNAKYASDGKPVLSGVTLGILLETENDLYETIDTAPDSEGLAYTFTPAPPAATGNSNLVTLAGTSWRVNDAGVDLGTAWREIGYDDTQAGWTSGAGLFGYTTNTSAYPAAIQTPVATGRAVYYLRTHFEFTNEPASVILVASNYLSDGAVFYLNGAEVKRVRLPAGDVLFSTAATGGPSVKGQAELAGLATAPLLIGDNVLAVEVHQTSGDTAELVFGMSLLAATQHPAVFTDPSQPPDRSVAAGDPTTFSAEFIGTPPLSFQWLKDSNPITGATAERLTIDPVLQADAGSYSLRISNPLATNVSRSALLTVTNSPVRVTDPTQPADQTVTEGLPASFAVLAAGSAPLSYQWFKAGSTGTNAIPGATNATFAIPDARTSDAGNYFAVVTNPFPSSVTSRVAQLTVTLDTNRPTALSVVGTPNKVTITFSEPVTPVSANALTNYSLSRGVTITTATQDANDATTVVLGTGTQTRGTSYILTMNNVFDRFNNVIAPDTTATFTSKILIDGSFDDWTGVPLVVSDPQDSTESTDFKDVYIASDADYLYLRVTLHSPGELGGFYNNFYFDTDNDSGTGYNFRLGSEMLIQGGGGYQEKDGAFNEGGISGLDWAIAPEGAATDFELRVSRHATYESDGKPVFTGNTVAVLLEAENPSYQTRDTAPDAQTLLYTFPLGPLTISFNQGQVTISWSGPGTLQSRSSLTTGSWQDVQNAPSPYLVQPIGQESYYRVSQ